MIRKNNQTYTKRQKNDKGRSMVEILAVIAIIGLLSIGGIVGYRYLMQVYIENETVNRFSTTVAAVKTGHATLPEYNECSTEEDCATMNTVPLRTFVSEKDLFEDNLSHKTAAHSPVAARVEQDGYTVRISGISETVCESLKLSKFGETCANMVEKNTVWNRDDCKEKLSAIACDKFSEEGDTDRRSVLQRSGGSPTFAVATQTYKTLVLFFAKGSDDTANAGCPIGFSSCNNVCCEDGTEVCDHQLGQCVEQITTTTLPFFNPDCPAGKTCGTVCCDEADYECKNGEKSLCCRTTETECGDICCPSGQECKDPVNGICCAEGDVVINGECCAPGNKCGTECCPSGQECKDETISLCCAKDDKVINGECCATDKQCGTVCCGGNEFCADEAKNKCCPNGSTWNAMTKTCDIPSDACQDICTGNFVICPEGTVCAENKGVCYDPETETVISVPKEIDPSNPPTVLNDNECCPEVDWGDNKCQKHTKKAVDALEEEDVVSEFAFRIKEEDDKKILYVNGAKWGELPDTVKSLKDVHKYCVEAFSDSENEHPERSCRIWSFCFSKPDSIEGTVAQKCTACNQMRDDPLWVCVGNVRKEYPKEASAYKLQVPESGVKDNKNLIEPYDIINMTAVDGAIGLSNLDQYPEVREAVAQIKRNRKHGLPKECYPEDWCKKAGRILGIDTQGWGVCGGSASELAEIGGRSITGGTAKKGCGLYPVWKPSVCGKARTSAPDGCSSLGPILSLNIKTHCSGLGGTYSNYPAGKITSPSTVLVCSQAVVAGTAQAGDGTVPGQQVCVISDERSYASAQVFSPGDTIPAEYSTVSGHKFYADGSVELSPEYDFEGYIVNDGIGCAFPYKEQSGNKLERNFNFSSDDQVSADQTPVKDSDRAAAAQVAVGSKDCCFDYKKYNDRIGPDDWQLFIDWVWFQDVDHDRIVVKYNDAGSDIEDLKLNLGDIVEGGGRIFQLDQSKGRCCEYGGFALSSTQVKCCDAGEMVKDDNCCKLSEDLKGQTFDPLKMTADQWAKDQKNKECCEAAGRTWYEDKSQSSSSGHCCDSQDELESEECCVAIKKEGGDENPRFIEATAGESAQCCGSAGLESKKCCDFVHPDKGTHFIEATDGQPAQCCVDDGQSRECCNALNAEAIDNGIKVDFYEESGLCCKADELNKKEACCEAAGGKFVSGENDDESVCCLKDTQSDLCCRTFKGEDYWSFIEGSENKENVCCEQNDSKLCCESKPEVVWVPGADENSGTCCPQNDTVPPACCERIEGRRYFDNCSACCEAGFVCRNPAEGCVPDDGGVSSPYTIVTGSEMTVVPESTISTSYVGSDDVFSTEGTLVTPYGSPDVTETVSPWGSPSGDVSLTVTPYGSPDVTETVSPWGSPLGDVSGFVTPYGSPDVTETVSPWGSPSGDVSGFVTPYGSPDVTETVSPWGSPLGDVSGFVTPYGSPSGDTGSSTTTSGTWRPDETMPFITCPEGYVRNASGTCISSELRNSASHPGYAYLPGKRPTYAEARRLCTEAGMSVVSAEELSGQSGLPVGDGSNVQHWRPTQLFRDLVAEAAEGRVWGTVWVSNESTAVLVGDNGLSRFQTAGASNNVAMVVCSGGSVSSYSFGTATQTMSMSTTSLVDELDTEPTSGGFWNDLINWITE